MPSQETPIVQRILRAFNRGPVRLFRNNVGMGWVGSCSIRFTDTKTVCVRAGDVLIRNARPLHAGLCEGSSDTVGWVSTVITEDLVGRRVAVILLPEVKDKGRASPEQLAFIRVANEAGAIAGVVRSEDELAKMIFEFRGVDNVSG